MGTAIDRFLAPKSGEKPESGSENEGSAAAPGVAPIAPSSPFNPYDEIVDGQLSQTRKAAQGAAFVASKRPDSARWAKVMELSQKTKLPSDVVDRNFDEISKAMEARQSEYDRMLSDTPVVDEWMTNPDHATVAGPDREHLANIERLVRGHVEASGGVLRNFARAAGSSFLAGNEAGIGHTIETLSQTVRGIRESDNPLFRATGLATRQLFPTLGAVPEAFVHAEPAATALKQQAGRIQERLSPNVASIADVHSAGDLADYTAYQVGQGVGSMASVVVGSLLGGPTGGLAAAGVQNYGDIRGEIEDTAPDTPNGFKNLLATGLTIPVALLDAITPGHLASKLAVQGFGKSIVREAAEHGLTRRVATEIAKSAIEEGGTEATQEAIQYLGIRVGTGHEIHPGELATRLVDAAIGGALGGGIFSGAVEAPRIRHGIRTQRFFAALGDATREAKLVQQLPQAMQDVVTRLTQDGPVANVYAPVQQWDEYWQSKDSDPAREAEAVTGSREAYDQAVATGSDLVIPTARYSVTLAPTEHNAFFADVLRLAPDQLNGREARELLQSARETMTDIVTEAASAGEAARTEAAEDPAHIIAREIEPELKEAKVPGGVKKNAALLGAFFKAVGAELGVDPVELFNRYRPSVQRGEAPPVSQGETGAGVVAALGSLNQGGEAAPAEAAPGEAIGQTIAAGAEELRRHREAGREAPSHADERRQMLTEGLRRVIPGAGDVLEQLTGRGKKRKQGSTVARGRIRFGTEGEIAIDLFSSADRSTFLHEAGHLFYHVLEDVARLPGASEQLRTDHATLREWVGAKEGAQLTTEQQEQIARGFEAYLLEGNAPSEQLRSAFRRFRQWLLDIYESISSLGVELTPGVRGVFDRLLATQQEIQAAEREGRAEPLFDDPQAFGMTPEQAASYEEAARAARQAAEDVVTSRLMKQMTREESAEWKALREPIRAEMEARVDADPTYRALALLTNGTKPDGSPLDEGVAPIKLYREAVVDSYGKELYDRLPRGVTATAEKENTVNPNMAAELLGFPSGRHLVEALAAAPKREAMIDQLADSRMQELYGERATPEQLRAEAREALRDKRTELIRKELEFLAAHHLPQLKGMLRAVTSRVPATEAVRTEARRIVGTKAVREISPALLEAAARRAATEAREALLRGDRAAAFDAKRKELLATEVHRAAVEAREFVESAITDFRQVFGRDDRLSKSRDMDMVNAARAILSTFGIGRTDKPAEAYLEQMRQYDPDQAEIVSGIVTEALSASNALKAAARSTTGRVDYRSLRYDDFVALHESVESLWVLARRSRQVEINGQLMERETVEADLGVRLESLTKPGARAGYEKAASTWDRAKMSLMGVRAALRRVESWTDAIDGTAPASAASSLGVFRRYVWNPVSEGATRFRLAKSATLRKYLSISEGIRGQLTTEAIEAPELGYTFSGTAELLGAMLHTGNESNLRKLLVGRHWGALNETGDLERARWDGFVDRMQRQGVLKREHYDYLQKVWDLFEELKAPAQKAHKEMYGHYFNEITKQSFSAFGRTYEGGYVPARTDPFVVVDAAIRAERDAVLHGNNSFMFPTTGRGFTKSRVERYAVPLLMDLRLVPSHIDAVLRFTHIEPRVKDVGRIVTSRALAKDLDAFDPTVRGDMLVPWLQRAATQRVEMPSKGWGGKALDAVARGLRKRTGMQILAVNVVNSLQQLTGISITAVKVGPGHLGAALWSYVRAPGETAAAMADKSEYMRTRTTDQVYEVQRSIDELLLNPTKYERLVDFTTRHGHFLTAATQNVVDVVTWTGAYSQAVQRGESEREAVRAADSAVRETQGSPFPEDISRFETGTPFQRLFTLFFGYFNMQGNLLTTEFTKAARDMGLRKGAGRMLYVYVLGFAIPAAISEAIMMATRGQPLDDDDDGPWDDLLAHFFGSQLSGAARMIPVIGAVAEASIRQFGTHSYDDRISTSAAISTLERATKAPHDVYKAIHDREATSGQIRDVLTALGLLSGLPLAPLAKPAGYLHDVSTGAAEPEGPVDAARGLVTGYRGGSR